MKTPLANLIRPTKLEEVVGQKHLVSKNGLISKLIESDQIDL